jgi:hypothetical protein
MTLALFCFFSCISTHKSDTSSISSSSVTNPTLFDQTCSLDADCMTVKDGNVCGCNCSYAAINISEEDAWAEHYAECSSNCDPNHNIDCAACVTLEAICVDGMCEAFMATE